MQDQQWSNSLRTVRGGCASNPHYLEKGSSWDLHHENTTIAIYYGNATANHVSISAKHLIPTVTIYSAVHCAKQRKTKSATRSQGRHYMLQNVGNGRIKHKIHHAIPMIAIYASCYNTSSHGRNWIPPKLRNAHLKPQATLGEEKRILQLSILICAFTHYKVPGAVGKRPALENQGRRCFNKSTWTHETRSNHSIINKMIYK